MSISSTVLYGSATLVNSDSFNDTYIQYVCMYVCEYIYIYIFT